MGTVGATGGYYQLSSLLSSSSGSSGTSSSAGTTLKSLENTLFSSSASGGSQAYLLDLSPAAQSLLGSGSASSAGGGSTAFTLTAAQEKTVTQILARYKDAPLTQATFEAIQSDLQNAGLSPQTLGAEDQVKSFNSTSVLLSALDGDYGALQTPAASASSEQTKESNFMKTIVSLWKAEENSGSGTSAASLVSKDSA